MIWPCQGHSYECVQSKEEKKRRNHLETLKILEKKSLIKRHNNMLIKHNKDEQNTYLGKM